MKTDREGLDIAMVVGGPTGVVGGPNQSGGGIGNPFGHVGVGVIGLGTYSPGTGTNAAREFFYAKNAAAIARNDPNAIANVTNYRVPFGIFGFIGATMRSSATEHFVGSYSVNIYPRAGNRSLLFYIQNNSSFTSFSAGIGPSWENGPMSSYRQAYYWTEPIRGF
jgi:hypothetical protein